MYHLFLATPEEVVYDGKANYLKAPGGLGYFEILPNHAPFMTTLTKGRVQFIDHAHKKWILEIPGGILEVLHNEVSLLADAVTLTPLPV